MDDNKLIYQLGVKPLAGLLGLTPSTIRVYAVRGIPFCHRWKIVRYCTANKIPIDDSFMDNPNAWQPKKQAMISPAKKIGKGV